MREIGTFTLDGDNRYRTVSDGLVERSGHDRESLLGAGPERLHDGDALERLRLSLRQLREDHETTIRTFEAALSTATGEDVPVQINLSLVSEGDGPSHTVTGNVLDRSGQRERERKLQAYASVLEASRDGIAVTDEELNHIIVNRAWAHTVGFEPAELIGQSTSILVEQGIIDRPVPEELQSAMDSTSDDENVRRRVEIDLRSPDYGEMTVELQATVVRRGVDSPFGVLIARDVTQRVKRERELERYERVVKTLGDGIYVLDAEGRVLEVNRTLVEMVGRDREDILGRGTRQFYEEADNRAFARAIDDLLRSDDEAVKRVEATLRTAHGDTLPVEVSLTLLPRGEDGEFRGTAGAVRDMSLHRQRRAQRDRLQTLLATMPDTVIVTDVEGYIDEVHGFAGWSGYDPEELVGSHIRETLSQEDAEKALEHARNILGNDDKEKATYELDVITRDGDRIPHEAHLALLPPDETGRIPGSITVLRDITDRKQLREKLRRQALYDDLTGLPNRSLFFDRLEAKLRGLREDPEARFAVVYMDLDRFKMINDSLGHRAGDRLLRRVAERLNTIVGDSDTVARLGGDEFAVLLGDVGSREGPPEHIERIVDHLEQPVDVAGQTISPRASLGVVVPEPGEYSETEVVLRDVDIAMYRSKNDTERCTLFEPNMREETEAKMKLEMELQDALDADELEVHYQPVLRFDGEDPRLGFEALVRWNHPERGYLTPGEFLPLAEKTGLLLPIDRWVLQASCRHLKAWWESAPEREPLLSVNCSGAQFLDPTFLDRVEEQLETLRLKPDALHLEIPERTVVSRPERASSIINRLREKGVHILLDDIGTGYSSTDYFASLPIDVPTIDRMFVFNFQHDVGGQTHHRLIRVIVNMAETVDPTALEEIITSNDTIRQCLLGNSSRTAIERGQELYHSRAMTADQVLELLASHEDE